MKKLNNIKKNKKCLLLFVDKKFSKISNTDSEFKHYSSSSQWPLNWELQSVWGEKLVNNEVVHKFKEYIEKLSDNKWKITPQFGINKDLAFENIKKNKTQMIIGHSTYWNDMKPAASFFASIPFGMSASEYTAWIKFGGGRYYWEQLYSPLNLHPLFAGDTGMQMGGWFPRQINSINDFEGIRMRIEGLGGPVLEKLGTKLINAPASKLLAMIDSGELDACEFATPVMDEAAGLHTTKKKLIYHYPGWHQSNAAFEFLVHKDLFNSLSKEQIAIIEAASLKASQHFTLNLLAENELVMEKFKKLGIEFHQFPDETLSHLKLLSYEVLKQTMDQDEFSKEVMNSYLKFLNRMKEWGPMSGAALWRWRK